MESPSDSRLNTPNDTLGTTTGDSVPTHSNTIRAATPRPSAYDNTLMSDKSVDEEALQDDLLATQMQATASYLSSNISPRQKTAAIAAFSAKRARCIRTNSVGVCWNGIPGGSP